MKGRSAYCRFIYERNTGMEYSSLSCCCLFGFNVAFNKFSVTHLCITTVSSCDRDLNIYFYSAASLKYHAPDT